MSKPLALAVLLSMTALFCEPATALAQTSTPELPGAPQPTRNYPSGPHLPQGGGSGNFDVSAAANDHGVFLWVVDNIQHAVVLCEKTDSGRDFTCSKKPLP
jgi:hypothetical protein